ncbi:MAG TPA: hypothetical protein VKA37_10605 [Halobacteriales archaeon]|nr:hypothetical protein [Halobacteriales archaeon]
MRLAYARDELLENAQEHSRECALMGHCIASGYGVVAEDDRLTLLDPVATRMVVEVVEESRSREGTLLRGSREKRDGAMGTTRVEEIGST